MQGRTRRGRTLCSRDRASIDWQPHGFHICRQQIASVDRALERIAAGTYGECVRCGGEISPARLEVRPEAALCIDCARQEQ